jgi:hypothetical protein
MPDGLKRGFVIHLSYNLSRISLRLVIKLLQAGLLMNTCPANGEKSKTPPDGTKKRPLTKRVAALIEERNGALPVWVRCPKEGVEHYTGFSRSKLYELDQKKLIRSVSIREPGQVKGTRLFELASILDYIERCAAEAEAAASLSNGKDRQGAIAA